MGPLLITDVRGMSHLQAIYKPFRGSFMRFLSRFELFRGYFMPFLGRF